MRDSINPFSPSGLSRYWLAAALLAAFAFTVPQRWLAWALGALAILEFLVGLRKMWRFGSRPLSTDADWRLTASPPSRWERRVEMIVAIATIGVAAVLGAGVMGVMAWKFWEVAVARLR